MRVYITIINYPDVTVEKVLAGDGDEDITHCWSRRSVGSTIFEPQMSPKYGRWNIGDKTLSEYFVAACKTYDLTKPSDVYLLGVISEGDKDTYIHPLNGDFTSVINVESLKDGPLYEVDYGEVFSRKRDVTHILSDIEYQSIMGFEHIEIGGCLIDSVPAWCTDYDNLVRDAMKRGLLNDDDDVTPIESKFIIQKLRHNHNKQLLYFGHIYKRAIQKLVDEVYNVADEKHREFGVVCPIEKHRSLYDIYNVNVFV